MNNKNSIIMFLDIIFSVSIFFIIAYLWFSSRLKQTSALLVSLSISILFMLCISAISIRRRRKKQYNQAVLDFNASLIRALLLMPGKEFKNFCSRLLGNTGKSNDRIVLGDNVYAFFAIQRHPTNDLKCDSILDCVREAGALGQKRVYIITTSGISPECAEMIRGLPVCVEITDRDALCSLMREKNIFPEINDTLSVRKPKTWRTISISIYNMLIDKNNAVRYLRYAAVLCIGAIFSRFNSYFTITAVIFVILSILSGLNAIKVNREIQSKKIF